MEVFVIGRVNTPGEVKLPQGSTLNQAISLAGGAKLLKGKIEFVRFNREGTIDRRMFPYNPGASADAPNNPVLASGDLIRVNDSLLSGSVSVLNELRPIRWLVLGLFIQRLKEMTTRSMENQPNLPLLHKMMTKLIQSKL